MLLLRTDSLPVSAQWLYELKLDGYRAIAFKRDGVVHLRSRNDNDFSARYPGVFPWGSLMKASMCDTAAAACVSSRRWPASTTA